MNNEQWDLLDLLVLFNTAANIHNIMENEKREKENEEIEEKLNKIISLLEGDK